MSEFAELTGLLAESGGHGEVAALPSLALVCVLAAVHVGGVKLTMLDRVPRSRWLSFGGGVSVAYIFVHVLPELPAGSETVDEHGLVLHGFLEHHIYIVALAGFATFYGVDRLVGHSTSDREPFGVPLPTHVVFWAHVGLFTVYNAVIAYLVHARESLAAATLFALAMGLHFLVNDFGMREAHEHLYDDVGRWLLAGGALAGGLVGAFAAVSELVIAIALAFVGGATVLNVVKEELPDERESRFWAFGVGVVVYTALLLAI